MLRQSKRPNDLTSQEVSSSKMDSKHLKLDDSGTEASAGELSGPM